MTRADILDALTRGCENVRQVAAFLGVPAADVWPVVDAAEASGHVAFVSGGVR